MAAGGGQFARSAQTIGCDGAAGQRPRIGTGRRRDVSADIARVGRWWW